MSKTVVFIHGAWMTPASWDNFRGFFEARGYRCLAPPWPFRGAPLEELRAHPRAALAELGVAEIVAHYERIVRALEMPPLLIGHSFGGLFVQLLLDRGVGRAGVAIDSAPPRGVLPLQLSALRSNAPVLLTWRGWKRVVHQTEDQFRYGWVHTLPPAEQRAAYDGHVVPETGRIFFQAALAPLNPRSPVRVDFRNARRAPLLLVAGGADHTCPAASNLSNYRKYAGNGAVTDFKEFAGRTHWTLAQDGWRDVAGYVAEWAERLPPRSA
jgi:pimeloyl-ACP methyl ester carboxylesterase